MTPHPHGCLPRLSSRSRDILYVQQVRYAAPLLVTPSIESPGHLNQFPRFAQAQLRHRGVTFLGDGSLAVKKWVYATSIELEVSWPVFEHWTAGRLRRRGSVEPASI